MFKPHLYQERQKFLQWANKIFLTTGNFYSIYVYRNTDAEGNDVEFNKVLWFNFHRKITTAR